MKSPPLLTILSLLALLTTLSSAHTTTLSLSATAPPIPNQWQSLSHLASTSITRAHHLKHPKKTNTNTTTNSSIPLLPRAYGGYSISLSFGTPPQKLSFVMDTGSSLVWFPCTEKYTCDTCNFPNVNPLTIPTFIPRSSTSTKIIGCKSPKCSYVYPGIKCKQCDKNCTQICPPYILQYGSGSTTGLLISDTLTLSETQSVPNFMVGCSTFSSRQPAGIAGFGRGPESLPAQLKLKKFSYCLVSHRFDDTDVSSNLILDGDSSAGGGAIGEINYTPFRKNPSLSNPAFGDYYYVMLRRITVGGVHVKAPYRYLVADSGGNGGTIVDSGTTFTFMERAVFDLVAAEFEKQVGEKYARAEEVERQTGLRPCFNVSRDESIEMPQLGFQFKGGKKMVLPLADYFSFLADSVICMTIVTGGDGPGGGVGLGPAIILGNYQQQNFYVEYDLENERFGFNKQLCAKG